MNIERYKPNGYKDTSRNLTPAAADTIYQAHLPMVQTPFSKYYRIVVTGDGGRIIRDTDHEVFGRQTISPGTLMFADKDATGTAFESGIQQGEAFRRIEDTCMQPEGSIKKWAGKFNPNHDLLNWDGVE